MAVFNVPNYLTKDGFGMSLNIRRGNPNPLDNSSVWASLAEAQNYAKTDPVAYVGQVLTVVTDVVVDEVTVKTATAYVIDNEAGDLKEVGSSPVGDEKSITVAEDGTVSLYGIAGLALTREVEKDGETVTEKINYQPLLIDGKLTWVEPSATTVEGLATEIEGIKTRLGALETTVGKAAEGENAATGLVKKVVDIEEKIGVEASEGVEATGLEKKIADNTVAIDGKVDKVEGKGLSTNDLTDDLKANYDAAYEHSQVAHAPADAQANVIEKISVNGTEQTITDKVVDITVPTKVSDLTNDSGYLTEHQDISGKADKATTIEGYGITDAYTKGEVDTAVQGAKDYAKGLVDAIPAQTDYTVSIEEDTTDSTVAKRYIFKQLGAEIGRIDLAKELVVTSGSVKEVAEADVPYTGAVVGDKYIELVIANQEAPIYVPAKDLVDIYTAASGAAEVQVAISNTNEISATLVNGGVTEEKLAEAVKTKLNKTWEEVGVAEGLVNALAEGQVKTNKEAIEAINNETTGILATAKGYADGLNSAMNGRVEALEGKAHEHANKTLLDTYTQTEVDLADAVAKKHEHANATILDGITAEKVATWDIAEKNIIASVDEAQFAIDGDRKLSLLDVSMGKVTGLQDALDGKANKGTTLAEYGITDAYTKTETEARIQEVLDGLSDTSETAASVSQALETYKTSNDQRVDTIEGKLSGIAEGAQVNVLEVIKINGVAQTITDKAVNILVATDTLLGVVMGSTAENKISVAEDGTMEVNSINVNKLVQDENTALILNGGSASV